VNDAVVALLIAVILGCVGIINAIVVAKSKVDEEVMWAKFKFAYQESLKKIDAVIVQKSTLRSWVKNKKVEIAREIFEEIRAESSYCVASQNGVEIYHTKMYNISAIKLDELKKKYESEGEG
jgi:hypothetical protein